MPTPRMLFRLLSYLFLAGVAVQFFLAGYGLPQFGAHSIDPHKGFAGALEVIVLLMFGAAIWAKMGRMIIGMIVVLFVLIVLQYLWASESLSPHWLRSFHVFDALLIAFLGYHIAERARLARPETSRV
ncbi:MAG TPA: DUF6220 domain-containing protein [Dehalococcoidia bacterium]|nr:DUF6220 domain-containing protein [Dehalococcoidia bacterium]